MDVGSIKYTTCESLRQHIGLDAISCFEFALENRIDDAVFRVGYIQIQLRMIRLVKTKDRAKVFACFRCHHPSILASITNLMRPVYIMSAWTIRYKFPRWHTKQYIYLPASTVDRSATNSTRMPCQWCSGQLLKPMKRLFPFLLRQFERDMAED